MSRGKHSDRLHQLELSDLTTRLAPERSCQALIYVSVQLLPRERPRTQVDRPRLMRDLTFRKMTCVKRRVKIVPDLRITTLRLLSFERMVHRGGSGMKAACRAGVEVSGCDRVPNDMVLCTARDRAQSHYCCRSDCRAATYALLLYWRQLQFVNDR